MEKKKELIELKNMTEQLIYTAEKALKDNAEKVPEDIKKSVEEKIKLAREASAKDDVGVLEKASEELSSEMQKIGEAMQKAAKNTTAENSSSAEQKTDGKVRDAEYEEKKSDENEKQKSSEDTEKKKE